MTVTLLKTLYITFFITYIQFYNGGFIMVEIRKFYVQLEISDYDDEIDFNNFFAPSKNDEHIAWKPLDV